MTTDIINSFVNLISETAIDAANYAKSHPYVCLAVLGLGAYALHKEIIGCKSNRVFINAEIDTGLIGMKVNNAIWIGKK